MHVAGPIFLSSFPALVLAALPPGYQDKLLCPCDYCRIPKETPDGWVGPQANFFECKNSFGVIKPVTTWGFLVQTNEVLLQLQSLGYHENECSTSSVTTYACKNADYPVMLDGNRPLPPMVMDGNRPLPPMVMDGNRPLPPMVLDGNRPVPPPMVLDGNRPVPPPMVLDGNRGLPGIKNCYSDGCRMASNMPPTFKITNDADKENPISALGGDASAMIQKNTRNFVTLDGPMLVGPACSSGPNRCPQGLSCVVTFGNPMGVCVGQPCTKSGTRGFPPTVCPRGTTCFIYDAGLPQADIPDRGYCVVEAMRLDGNRLVPQPPLHLSAYNLEEEAQSLGHELDTQEIMIKSNGESASNNHGTYSPVGVGLLAFGVSLTVIVVLAVAIFVGTMVVRSKKSTSINEPESTTATATHPEVITYEV